VRQPTKWKIAAYVAAWIGALVATDPTFGLLPVIYMFPLGLFAFVPPEHRQVNGWFVIVSAVLLYVVHGFFYFRARTTLTGAILYLILLALLFSNAVGCRAMAHAH
jgi:hypothetical protein